MQERDSVLLGTLSNGGSVTFAAVSPGGWGIEIGGGNTPRFVQPNPVQIELYRHEQHIRQIEAGYASVEKDGDAVVGRARVEDGSGVAFSVTDRWTLRENVVSIHRTLTVSGNEAGAGFSSAIRLRSAPDLAWPEVRFLAPGLLYGDPAFDGPASPGGTWADAARRFTMREDFLPAPLFALWLPNGDSLVVLDEAPQGHTTLEETRSSAEVLIDERFAFGGLGANEADAGGIEIGFWLPGTTAVFPARRFGRWGVPEPVTAPPPAMIWRRRYNPVRDGLTHSYRVGFRFGTGESFPELTRNAYRWAWRVLKPALNRHDTEIVRRSLIDQLSSQVVTVAGRTGIPFLVSTVTGQVWPYPDDPPFFWRATMGFVGKNIEAADMLLREAERDPGPRGQTMRRQGLDIIATFLREVPMAPPTCTGFNLRTGAPSMTNPPVWYLREATDDLRMLMEAHRRERRAGRDHPEWLRWCRDFADWALTRQRDDGSFPRSFQIDTEDVEEESGTTSYNVVPLFLMLGEDLGDHRYRDAAIRAAEYVWERFGSRGVFVGGAIDNPDITDKEAGMLSLEAFLGLYEATRERKWLDRARVAADFAESWMWIWNVPMPEDADDARLHWKKDVPTVGVQGITALVAGHVDQYLDWSAPAYARLYRYTGDAHYREVARLLLHNTKAMLALPGRLYGMLGPGWQQENWRMGASRDGRGFGTPEKWMPWVSTNHLYGIYGLEEFDPALLEELSAKP